MAEYYYKVAEHSFLLSDPQDILGDDGMANYIPFRTHNQSDYLFRLTVTEDFLKSSMQEFICQLDDDAASISVFRIGNEGFRFNIVHPMHNNSCILDIDEHFRAAQVVLPNSPNLRLFCLNTSLMLLYALATARFNTLLIHASAVTVDGKGYAFLGKSGTGKSTHSKLWLQNIEGSMLLNDDNPVIRITEGNAWIWGSPWSGKTSCYINTGVPLKGVVRLRQHSINEIVKFSSLKAYAELLTSCSCMKWEEKVMSPVHDTVAQLATTVACYRLSCLPNREAAELCFTTIE